jgi:hypothetical protein
MTALDRLIPKPSLVEINRVDLAGSPEEVWRRVRHAELAHAPATKALFALRTIFDRSSQQAAPPGVRLADMKSSPEQPGFQILIDEPPHEVAVGAIGKVWRLRIPFIHVATAEDFLAFSAPGYVKVAWALRVSPLATGGAHLELEVRVAATDDLSWRKFRRYFMVIGPASRFIRWSLLGALAKDVGRPAALDERRVLPDDERLPDAVRQMTHRVDIAAAPEQIWPWLVQMGGGRAGFYSIDVLDNGGTRSAREIHPDLQHVSVGDVIPATPRGSDGFEVLQIEPARTLVLGGLFDRAAGRQLAFSAPRPERFWHMTWAFILEPLDRRSTRLTVRVRGAFSPHERRRAAWMQLVHPIMERAQLRHLRRRAEGTVGQDDWRDIAAGVGGALRMTFGIITPFLRQRRSRWGLDATSAVRPLPGDELVPAPRWGWTHAIDIDAPASRVWPWVAQVGADRGGFYSYQWLENLAGCRLRNAETLQPEWEVRPGDGLLLHPKMPPLPIAAIEPGHYFVAHAPARPDATKPEAPWVAASWLFLVEPLSEQRSRFVSRYRVASSDDLKTRVSFGPALVEPIGHEMDRRMLLGIKARAEAAGTRA